jgi:hypothetical protein
MTRLDPPWFLGTNLELYVSKCKNEMRTVEKESTRVFLRSLKEQREKEMREIAVRALLSLNK